MNQEKDIQIQDPKEMFYNKQFPVQTQEAPGIQMKMRPVPDSGEETYKGHERLMGRKALITGGDSGIGRAVAIAFAREGADIAINYLPKEKEDADSLAAVLKKENKKLSLIPGDIRNEETCKEIIEKANEDLSGIDILVLNAAVQVAQKNIEDITTEQLMHIYNTNVFPMFWMVKAALPHLKPGSSIILTSSAEYYDPSPTLLDYASSKYAVVGFGRALAKQLAEKGIRVNIVCPGPIWTPLEISGGLLEEDIPKHGQNTLLKRSGQPVELAGVYVFLASNESSYVTAETYGVAGGKHGT